MVGSEAPVQRQYRVHKNPVSNGYIAELDTGKLIRLSERLGAYLLGESPANERVLITAERIGLSPAGKVDTLPPPSGPRLHVHSPLKIQYDLVRSGDDARWFRQMSRLLNPTILFGGSAILLVSGPLSVLLRDDSPWTALWSPINYFLFVLLIPGILVTTVVHEFAHAVTLRRFGRGPNRAGVMFYLMAPAGFCDISPVWMLPRAQRLAVCLAGVACHLGLAGSSFLVGTVTHGDLRQLFDLFGLFVGLTGLFNLIPFVKFDGYLALVAWMDAPFLQAHSSGLVSQGLARAIVKGEGLPSALSRKSLFGVMCVATPPLIIGFTTVRLFSIFSAMGGLGRILLALLLLLIIVLLGQLVAKIASSMRSLGANGIQFAIYYLTVAVVVLLFLFLPIDLRGSGGFHRTESNSSTVELAFSPSAASHGLPESVQLEKRGLWRKSIAKATVHPAEAHECMVERMSLTPFYTNGLHGMTRMTCVSATASDLPEMSEGLMSFNRGEVPMWKFLYDSLFGKA